ncbi:hypothetical protein EJ04DRAFT_508595 [Polyplosphaeria fusca]|uniref:Uncharacterized protein n=1 Tax=Polyplosphaeria fusca TaxID=682080 RepID=A0A9P4V4N2_9PLEO|nr:hypothetical protein EJ04DRAFT_508595 [Polyplosphaeria fusca]
MSFQVDDFSLPPFFHQSQSANLCIPSLSSRRSSHRYGQLEPISLVLDRIKYFISKGYIIPGNFKLALLDDIKHLIDFNSTATVYPEITKKPEEDKQLIFKEQRALEAAGTFFEMHTIALLSDLLDHPERLNKTQQQILDAIAIFEAYTKYVYANVGDYGLFINKGDSTARKEAYGGPYLPAITAKEAGQTVAAVIMAVVGMVILIGMATYAVKLLQERRRA